MTRLPHNHNPMVQKQQILPYQIEYLAYTNVCLAQVGIVTTSFIAIGHYKRPLCKLFIDNKNNNNILNATSGFIRAFIACFIHWNITASNSVKSISRIMDITNPVF